MAINPLLAVSVLNKIANVRNVMNGINTAMVYLQARGMRRKEILAMLANAAASRRDISSAEVGEAIGTAQEALDNFRDAIEE